MKTSIVSVTSLNFTKLLILPDDKIKHSIMQHSSSGKLHFEQSNNIEKYQILNKASILTGRGFLK